MNKNWYNQFRSATLSNVGFFILLVLPLIITGCLLKKQVGKEEPIVSLDIVKKYAPKDIKSNLNSYAIAIKKLENPQSEMCAACGCTYTYPLYWELTDASKTTRVNVYIKDVSCIGKELSFEVIKNGEKEKPKDIIMCEKITNYNKHDSYVDACLSRATSFTNETSFCKGIKNKNDQKICYASQTTNIEMCNIILDANEQKSKCYINAALKLNDYQVCENTLQLIGDWETYDDSSYKNCYKSITGRLSKDTCLLMGDELFKIYCLEDAAIENKDYRICLKIDQKDRDAERNWCLIQVARLTNDEKACNYVSADYLQRVGGYCIEKK